MLKKLKDISSPTLLLLLSVQFYEMISAKYLLSFSISSSLMFSESVFYVSISSDYKSKARVLSLALDTKHSAE